MPILHPIVFPICLAQTHPSLSFPPIDAAETIQLRIPTITFLTMVKWSINIVSYDLVHQMNISSTDYAKI